MPKNLPTAVAQSFEDIKQTNEHGAEYWSARDLQNLLGYTQWRRFEDVIKRAITSCKESGNEPSNHFADAGKMVGLGSVSYLEETPPNLPLSGEEQDSAASFLLPSLIRGGLGRGFFGTIACA